MRARFRRTFGVLAAGVLAVLIAGASVTPARARAIAVPADPPGESAPAAIEGSPERQRPLDFEIETRGFDLPPEIATFAEPAAAQDLEELRQRIARVVETSGAVGVAVSLVNRSGAIWSQGFGLAALDGKPMTADTLFRVGSLTKPFIALAILRLVESGRLRLDDRIADLVPDILAPNRWHDSHPIRVAHLLEHTAGFDEMRFNEIFDPEGRQDRPLTEVLARNPRSRMARWRPGTRFSYSQPGYTLAAAIIERVTGMSYETFLEQEVFGPLGIEGASLRLDPATLGRLATGHHRRFPVDPAYILHRPAGNLAISIAGLGRLLALQLGRGDIQGQRFLGRASIERMERCETLPNAPPASCYGLANWGDVGEPVAARGHGGFVPGYFGFYRYVPQLGVGMAVLVNDTAAGPALGRVAFEVFRYLMRGWTPTPPRPPVALVDPGRYVGTYRLAAPEVEFLRFHTDVYGALSIREEAGRLVLVRPDGKRRVLVPTGPDLFRFGRDVDSSVRFSRTDDGRLAVTLNRGYFERENATWSAIRKTALDIAVILLMAALFAPAVAAALRQRRATFMLLPPFAAAICLFVMGRAFAAAREAAVLGAANTPTMIVWLSSWAFALFACGGLRPTLTALFDRRGGIWLRLYALSISLAAALVALHLARYGLIGLRTWAW